MALTVVFETHSTTEDNERGRATGWLGGRLSATGRDQARALGDRRRDDGIDAVASSDLARARETVEVAFGADAFPVLFDWRLRECDYGALNGAARELVLADRTAHLTAPYPSGESWRDAVARVGRCLTDLRERFEGRRVLVVGHVATYWGLEHWVGEVPLEVLAGRSFDWQPGWEYVLS